MIFFWIVLIRTVEQRSFKFGHCECICLFNLDKPTNSSNVKETEKTKIFPSSLKVVSCMNTLKPHSLDRAVLPPVTYTGLGIRETAVRRLRWGYRGQTNPCQANFALPCLLRSSAWLYSAPSLPSFPVSLPLRRVVPRLNLRTCNLRPRAWR